MVVKRSSLKKDYADHFKNLDDFKKVKKEGEDEAIYFRKISDCSKIL